MHARPITFALAAGVAGCCGMCAETTSSENVRTEGMAVEMRVDARGDGKTTVDTILRAGGPLSNLYPQIAGGDRLEVTNGTDTVPLGFGKHVIERPSYFGVLPGDSSGRSIELRFVRATNTTALGTKVVMPPAFAITSPPAGERYSPARSALTVTWTPVGPTPVDWTVEGSCIANERGQLRADTGRLEVALRAAPPPDGGPPHGRCDVVIRLERTARGVVDPAFGHGGSVHATQRRDHAVSFTP